MSHTAAISTKTDIHRGFARPAERPPTPGDPQAIATLTCRERQVLTLLGHAAGNREISRRLGIAERTVKAHLTNLMAKIKVSSRTEAALYSYAHHPRLARSSS
ncbi:response regulator transcription factor [Streptomyces tropicalis]|uniref:LuxR C-terminal-related transcriptional regulator n=1 Tax=Streptomyces tropicalis TaxID=3034234 RepID=A0ABT6A8Q9_9ACTN|nr:LuxR C-terminal-related transcriptional regulator [Streptomyces tropicalis]MDF3301028.1 LuxR C-terminal-related transcriptional regulator [Streptomyces tropicalis]